MEGTAAASLPDDVVREILERLDNVVDLFRCAMSCKQMGRIILEASFLRRLRWPDSTPSFLSGLFISQKFVYTEAPLFLTTFVPTKHSLFGPHRRSLKSFSPTRGRKRGLLHNMVPLVARHGLLLLQRMDMPNVNVHPASTVWLAVCNLFSGACDELPPLKCDWDFDQSSYAILTTADCSSNAEQQPSSPPGYSAFFKVLSFRLTSIDNHITFTVSHQASQVGADPVKYPLRRGVIIGSLSTLAPLYAVARHTGSSVIPPPATRACIPLTWIMRPAMPL
uniref:Uncharacterized protein n=1 Tax=Aegilops tauschii TaxID=37682 RepID=M8BT39_AEGTA